MKRACNLLIYRALEASVKKYADTIGKPIGIIGQATDFSVVVFRLHFMLVSEEHLMKSHKNQWLLNLLSPLISLGEPRTRVDTMVSGVPAPSQ